MKILLYIDGENACSYYRALIPGRWLSKAGKHYVVATKLLKEEYIRDFDVIVFQKRFFPEDLNHLEMCRKLSKKTVLEFDDDYLSLPTWNGTAKVFDKIKHCFLQMLPKVSKVTVSTEYLREQYLQYAENIVTLHNSVDTEAYRREMAETKLPMPVVLNHPEKIDVRGITGFKVGWAGSPTHQKDLELVSETLIKLAKRLPNLKIFMMGAASQRMVNYVPKSQLFLIEGVPVQNYMWTVSQLGLTVGIAPIVKEKFNLSKSNLKILEYMMMGAVPLASNVGEYRRTLLNREAGFMCSSPQEWELRLIQLYSNTQLIDQMKMEGQKLLKEFDISETWRQWETAYQS